MRAALFFINKQLTNEIYPAKINLLFFRNNKKRVPINKEPLDERIEGNEQRRDDNRVD